MGGYCNRPNECICRSGYSGARCEVGKLLLSHSVLHVDGFGGETVSMTLGNFVSLLAPLVSSQTWAHALTHARTDLLPCQRRSPCQNGATCTNDGSGGYRCTCVTGYSGTNCQTNINDCSPNPCHNGGTCRVSAGGRPQHHLDNFWL